MGKNQNSSCPNEEMEKDTNSDRLKAEKRKQNQKGRLKKDFEEITC